MAIGETVDKTDRCSTTSDRSSQCSIRRRRIEYWANKGRVDAIQHDKAARLSMSSKISIKEKRSYDLAYLADRHLDVELLQIGEDREKFIELSNFDQKLFASRRACLHKDNGDIRETLSFVRKCCKFTDSKIHDEIVIDSTIGFDKTKTTRFQSLALAQAKLKKDLFSNAQVHMNISNKQLPHSDLGVSTELGQKLTENLKPAITPQSTDKSSNKSKNRHVEFNFSSQSAYVLSKPRASEYNRDVKTVHGIRPYEPSTTRPTTPMVKASHPKEEKLHRPSSRTFVTKKTFKEFCQHPERFLSETNRYLPLLRHQAMKMDSRGKNQELRKQTQEVLEKERSQSPSHTSLDSSETDISFSDDDLKSELNSYAPSQNSHHGVKTEDARPVNRTDVIEVLSKDLNERKTGLLKLRNREYANLQRLIHLNRIDQILKPFSPMKVLENDQQSLNMDNTFNRLDSKAMDKHKRRRINIEENLSNLGILIF